MEILQNLELNFLQKNYEAVDTNNSVRGSVYNYTLEDWNNAVTSISFGPESKLSKQAIKSVIAPLKSLNEINLNDYKSEYDISFDEFEFLTEAGINVVFNTDFIYTDSKINKSIRIDQYNQLCDLREYYENKIEAINAQIEELGI